MASHRMATSKGKQHMEITWADRIKTLEARGWSLTAIGDAIGKSTSAVSDIKQKRTKEPGGMAAVNLHHLYATGAKPPASAKTGAAA